MLLDTKFETNVNIPYGELKNIIKWCNSNCSGEWRYLVIDDAGDCPGNYKFRFEEERDLLTFLLWIK